jgi:rod shape-determining protein MreD
MMETNVTHVRFTIIGGVVSLLLQIMIAPNISILGVVPNFILGFVVLNAILNTKRRSTLAGFILGFLYDLVAQGPLGIMSFVLAILAYAVSSVNKELLSGSWAIKAVLLLVAAFFGELLHAALLSIVGFDTDFITSFVMRTLPGTLYDGVFGLIVFPLMYRFDSRRKTDPEILKGKFL